MPCVIIKRIIPGVDFFAVLDTVFILGFKEIEDAFAVDTVKLRIRLRCRTRGLCIRRSCGLLCCRGSVVTNVLA